MESQAAVVEAVAKYFYFCCLDEQQSFAASLKVLAELEAQNWLNPEHRDRWVATLSKWKSKLDRVRPRPWSQVSDAKGMRLPPDFDLSVWASFIGTGEMSEVEAVLLSRILSFSDEEIALGLGVTAGTVRYRVGRGLRHLGGYIES